MSAPRRTKIIAELALGHDGSLLDAFGLVRACARAGVDAVKFQAHLADIESGPHEQLRPGLQLPADRTRQDYWRRTAFDQAGWRKLRTLTAQLEIELGASVFSAAAVDMLLDVVEFWKMPAGEWDNYHVWKALAGDAEHRRIYWSLGFSERVPAGAEIFGDRVTPMYCVSAYPCGPEQMLLSRVNERVGLSDHSGWILPGLIAAWRHAPAIEVHVCWSHEQLTPDAPASLTMGQLRELVEGVRWVERLGRNPLSAYQRAQAHQRYVVGRRRV